MYIYGIVAKPVTIPCALDCRNCPEKATVSWERNGVVFLTQDSLYPRDDSYLIKSYSLLDNDDLYTCIITYKKIRIRSSSTTHLKTAELPNFILEPQTRFMNETVIFKCCEVNTIYRNKLHVQWYKNGLTVKPSETVVMYDQFLLISHANMSDTGLYTCHVKFQNTSLAKTSRSVLLNVTQGFEQETPIIIHLTSNRQVLLNESMVIYCFVSASAPAMVRLYKVSANGRHHRQLIQHLNFVVFKLFQITKRDTGKYICESSAGFVRTSDEFQLTLVSKPSELLKGISHINTVVNYPILFYCNPSGLPIPTVVWYYNATRVDIKSNKLNNVSEAGMYQCIATNVYGSNSKSLYITFNDTGQAPRQLSVKILSAHELKLSWLPPKKEVVTWYRIFWDQIDPKGLTREDFTDTLHFVINKELYGGVKYKVSVCDTFVLHCIYKIVTMPHGIIQYPEKVSYKYLSEKSVQLGWLGFDLRFDKNIITSYNIYSLQIFGIDTNQVKKETAGWNETSKIITITGSGVYKVWLTASNDAGESPKSNTILISTDEEWKACKDLSAVTVKWVSRENFATVNWEIETDVKAIEFKIYIISIPYNNYWRNVKTITVGKDIRSYKLTGLSRKAKYRITVAPVTEWKSELHKYIKTLGKRTHVILYDNNNMKRGLLVRMLNEIVVTEPRKLKCLPLNFNSFLVSWKEPEINEDYDGITHYNVKVFGESDGVETNYSTVKTHIIIRNITKDVWYGVRVQADQYNFKKKIHFHYTDYISCRRKIKVSTAAQQIQIHSVVKQKSSKELLLTMKWKPPLYTGDSIYSYDIRVKSVIEYQDEVIIIKIPLPYKHFHLMLQQHEDEWIYSNPISIIQGFRQEILITPHNDAGQGEAKDKKTSFIYGPVYSVATSTVSITNTTLQPLHNYDSKDDGYSQDKILGVVIGLSASAVFILVFFVVCILKEPWRKKKKHLSKKQMDSFLYLRKLNDLQKSSSILEDETETATSSDNFKILHRKPFSNFFSRNKRFANGNHQSQGLLATNSVQSSNTTNKYTDIIML